MSHQLSSAALHRAIADAAHAAAAVAGAGTGTHKTSDPYQSWPVHSLRLAIKPSHSQLLSFAAPSPVFSDFTSPPSVIARDIQEHTLQGQLYSAPLPPQAHQAIQEHEEQHKPRRQQQQDEWQHQRVQFKSRSSGVWKKQLDEARQQRQVKHWT